MVNTEGQGTEDRMT